MQKRIIFFVFDGGTGVGHLRRLACIAKCLQGPFSCLIVSGHRTASNWFVSEECEYVHLPSWDSLIPEKSGYWKRAPFVDMEKNEAIRFRKEILHGIVRGYKPDAIFVDHLPLGAGEELDEIIENVNAKKYFVTRGVLNQTEDINKLILGGKAKEYLENFYDRIFVACDKKILDFTKKYNLSENLKNKTIHTGYVTEQIINSDILKIREERGLGKNDVWVVCSAGGGQRGENLIQECLRIAEQTPDVFFDILLGPRSSIQWKNSLMTCVEKNKMRLHKESQYLRYMHVGSDIVISSGGYNSLLEAIQGNASIISFPYRLDHKDEQFLHSSYLLKYLNLKVSTDLADLDSFLKKTIEEVKSNIYKDRRKEINLVGAEYIKKIVWEDLDIANITTSSR